MVFSAEVIGLMSVIKDRIYRLPSEKQKQKERHDRRHRFRDRRPRTTACPGCWVMETHKLKKHTVYFVLADQSSQGRIKVSFTGMKSPTNQPGKVPICTPHSPQIQSHSQQGPPLSLVSLCKTLSNLYKKSRWACLHDSKKLYSMYFLFGYLKKRFGGKLPLFHICNSMRTASSCLHRFRSVEGLLFGYLLGCFLSPPILFDSSLPYLIFLPIQYMEKYLLFTISICYMYIVQCTYTFDALLDLSLCKENKRKNIKRRLFKIYTS